MFKCTVSYAHTHSILFETNYCTVGSCNLIETVVNHTLDLLEVIRGHVPFLLKILQRYPAVTLGLQNKTFENLQTHKEALDFENAIISHASNNLGLVGFNKVATS